MRHGSASSRVPLPGHDDLPHVARLALREPQTAVGGTRLGPEAARSSTASELQFFCSRWVCRADKVGVRVRRVTVGPGRQPPSCLLVSAVWEEPYRCV